MRMKKSTMYNTKSEYKTLVTVLSDNLRTLAMILCHLTKMYFKAVNNYLLQNNAVTIQYIILIRFPWKANQRSEVSELW